MYADRLRKCISIGILDFKLTEESRYHRKYTLRGEDGAVYPDLFEIHTIELGKPLSGDDVIDDWIRLFNAEDEEDLAMIKRKSLGIAEVMEDKGVVSEELRTRILNQKDLDILSGWHRLAARSRTVDEFKNAVSEGQE